MVIEKEIEELGQDYRGERAPSWTRMGTFIFMFAAFSKHSYPERTGDWTSNWIVDEKRC